MKTFIMVVLFLGLTAFGTSAQTANGPANINQLMAATNTLPAATPYHEVERGPNHKLWQRETYEQGANGEIIPHVYQYKELATGMHYLQNGQWVESKELIEPYASGAIAQYGSSQIIFANNLNTEGAIDVQTVDGKRLTSNILGIGYYDSSTGQAVMVAQIKDSYGALLAHNQVIYRDAFDGVKADVQYTYIKSGMEQDVILREQPPTPESCGLNSATTKLEVFTEFLNPPQATVAADTDPSGATVDEDISWGATRIGHGHAFDLTGQGDTGGLSVEKQYITVQGRKILIELVPLKAVAASLSKLPLQSSIQTKQPVLASSQENAIPGARKPGENPKPMKLASVTPPAKGYVLDYITLNVTQTNFTFQGDMTYLISGDVNLAGATTLEGGSVIKMSSDSPGSINVLGTVACQTGPYRPAIFTSADDGTVGQGVSYSNAARTGALNVDVYNYWSDEVDEVDIVDAHGNWVVSDSDAPVIGEDGNKIYSFTGSQGTYTLYVYNSVGGSDATSFSPTLNNVSVGFGSDGESFYSESGTALFPVALSLANGGTVHDLRFSNLGTGISGAANYSITNAQFVNCGTAIQTENSTLYAGNILMSSVGTGFYGQNFKGRVEQLTFDQGTHVTGDPAGTESGTIVALTNVLLTAVTDYGVVPVATNHVAKLSSASGIYKIVGAGGHYLATNSPYHNAGTAGISPSMLTNLTQRTTYPPIVYTNVAFRAATNLAPRAVRDSTGTPDYGYHYDPLDYAFSGSDLYSNMTIAAGTAIAYVEGSGVASLYHFYGLSLTNWANLTLSGTAIAPCWFVNDNTVMEGGNGQWTNRDSLIGGMMLNGTNSSSMPQINASFTKLATLAGNIGPWSDNSGDGVGHLMNCEFFNAGIGYGTWPSYYCTNCLFMRAVTYLSSVKNPESFSYVNCTFFGGCLDYKRTSGQQPLWLIKNTSFDGTSFWWSDYYQSNTNYTTFDYNTYNTNNLSWQTYPNPYGSDHGTNEIVGSHDLRVTNFNWQVSWFGNFYLPPNSPLIDKGSTTADQLGLYHFTTQTNQMKETNSIVDIGYHYVATDTYGNPLDSNSDGIPDYQADANGNGLVDNGENRWTSPPVITTQPVSQTVGLNTNVFFMVAVTSLVPVNYQWYFNTNQVFGASNATLTISNVQYTNVGNYFVVISNTAGSVTSTVAILNIGLPPSISTQPTNFVVIQGSNAIFSVGAAGTPLNYQWYLNGTNNLIGATNSSLLLTNVQPASGSNYSVVITNLAGSVTSSNATLTVMSWTVDSDYDGRSDAQEILDGTDPFNPNSGLAVQLAFFPFDNTNTWAGSAGQLPLQATNVIGVPSWDTNAVLIDSMTPAVLRYRDVETNGNANINLRSGTVRFWFRPDWSSTNAGGAGPQAEGRLIEMGTQSTTGGWWGLVVKSAGTNIYFGTQTNSTSTLATNLTATISWQSNIWHQVALTYSVSNSSLYVDGQAVVTNGLGVTNYPGLAVRANGFTIGSSASGTNQARGQFEDLDTFNYALGVATISSNYLAAVARDKNGNGLGDFWEWQNFGGYVDPSADPDGDGLSNLEEYQNGSNPNNFDPVRLAHWGFDDPPNWLDDLGLAPSAAYGLYPVISWSGDAVRISPAQNSMLSYPSVRANGADVVICPARTGSIRFWFKPDWASFGGIQGGPNDNVRLFEMGEQTTNATYGWFCLWVNTLGTTLTFSTEANGVHVDNAVCPVSFTTNAWYQIVLTYTPTNSVMYLNGMVITNGVGLTNLPSQALTQGFQLGCSWDGVHQAGGVFDELETFNYH